MATVPPNDRFAHRPLPALPEARLMPIAKAPVFLEKQGYRMRRLMDAVRLMPFLGLALWMVPLMWSRPDDAEATGTAMSVALLYIFGVWCLLPLIGWLLWRKTKAIAEAGAAEPTSVKAP